MKFLIVSGKEYSVSNRGIDVITSFLAKKHTVDHLFFFTRSFREEKKISDTLTQLYFIDNFRIYRDKFKYFLPAFLLESIFRKMILCASIDFSKYDYVILESGYPIFLTDFIDAKIIYRQSDPIEIALNSKRLYFKKKEEKLFNKAISISSALNPIFYEEKYFNKCVYWKSGYLSSEIESSLQKENLIVYMGGVPIDYSLLKQIAKKYKEYSFIIIGNHKDKVHLKNVVFTGYLNFSDYKNYIIKSKLFFFPIRRSYLKNLEKAEITSKFFFPLSMGIPFVTRCYGTVNTDDYEKKIFTFTKSREAEIIFDEILNYDKFQDFTVSESTKKYLFTQTIEYKENELYEYFKKMFTI